MKTGKVLKGSFFSMRRKPATRNRPASFLTAKIELLSPRKSQSMTVPIDSRRRAATLSLVVILLLGVVVIGIAVFTVVKIMGGQIEVSNATDAGILNVAHNAIYQAKVPIAGTDFLPLIAPESAPLQSHSGSGSPCLFECFHHGSGSPEQR